AAVAQVAKPADPADWPSLNPKPSVDSNPHPPPSLNLSPIPLESWMETKVRINIKIKRNRRLRSRPALARHIDQVTLLKRSPLDASETPETGLILLFPGTFCEVDARWLESDATWPTPESRLLFMECKMKDMKHSKSIKTFVQIGVLALATGSIQTLTAFNY